MSIVDRIMDVTREWNQWEHMSNFIAAIGLSMIVFLSLAPISQDVQIYLLITSFCFFNLSLILSNKGSIERVTEDE